MSSVHVKQTEKVSEGRDIWPRSMVFYRTAPANATIHDAIRPFRPNPAENICWKVDVDVAGGGGGWLEEGEDTIVSRLAYRGTFLVCSTHGTSDRSLVPVVFIICLLQCCGDTVAVFGLLIINVVVVPHSAQHSFISSYRYLVIAFRSKYSFISSYRYYIDIWREMNRRKIGTDTTTTKTQHRSSEFSYILQVYIYV